MDSIYFDNSATSFPKPDSVIEGITEYLTNNGSNPGRSAHRGSIEAGMMLFQTRQLLADLYGVSNPMKVIFTFSATDALNMAIKGLLKDGDHVITTAMDHNSVLRPLNDLKDRGVIDLTILEGDETGFITPEMVENNLNQYTTLVVINHISNVNGVTQPIKDIGQLTRAKKITLLVDCSQSAGVYDFDMKEYGVDLIALTGHKALYGPTGTGALILADSFDYKRLSPLRLGGTGSKSDRETQPDFLPDMFESGTLNVCGIYGLNRGINFVLEKGLPTIREHKKILSAYFITEIEKIQGVKTYNQNRESGVVSFVMEDRDINSILTLLEEHEISVRQGLHCAPLAHKVLGTFPKGTIRVSFGLFNTKREIDRFIEILKEG